mgnify:FL=1
MIRPEELEAFMATKSTDTDRAPVPQSASPGVVKPKRKQRAVPSTLSEDEVVALKKMALDRKMEFGDLVTELLRAKLAEISSGSGPRLRSEPRGRG